MGKFIDLTGKKYGRLSVIKLSSKTRKGRTYWKCACDCGNITDVDAYKLKTGHTKSCGCIRGETHGMCNHRLYRTYKNMINRCYSPAFDKYPYYGGRGISVCNEWRN